MAVTRHIRTRIAATESMPSAEILPALRESGLARAEALALITDTGERLRRELQAGDDSPIAMDAGRIRISDVAGIVRLTPALEIEVAPKFLGHRHEGWTDDFLALMAITGEGGLLSGPVHARYGASSDLASLIGEVFTDYYWRNQRQPLRRYRKRSWRDWSLDGEVDFDRYLERSSDGIPQTTMVLDRENPFTAVIAQAAEVLMAEVQQPGVRNRVAQVRASLPPEIPPYQHVPPLPSRLRQWEPLVELSKQVCVGLNLTPREGHLEGPGFLVRTWRAWEKLIYLALRLGSDPGTISAHELHQLGTRNGEPLRVNPDITAGLGGGIGLVDAKYKTRIDAGRLSIARGDVYEAHAFLEAADASTIVLAYPRPARKDAQADQLGTCLEFERITIDERTILGVEVEVRGIGKKGGYRAFADSVATNMRALLNGAVTSGPGAVRPRSVPRSREPTA